MTPTWLSRGARRVGLARRNGWAAKAGASLLVLLLAGAALLASVSVRRSAPPPIGHTFPSPEAAAQAVVRVLQARDVDGLRRLALSEDEFRAHVWPALPASRPERNTPFDFVWDTLRQHSEGSLRQTMAAVADTSMEVKAVRFLGEATVYDEVTVYRDTELVVVLPDGTTRATRLFGSMIEQGGGWKVFSYVVDD